MRHALHMQEHSATNVSSEWTSVLMRIALIHALRHSLPPIEAAFARLWPEAELMNLLGRGSKSAISR